MKSTTTHTPPETIQWLGYDISHFNFNIVKTVIEGEDGSETYDAYEYDQLLLSNPVTKEKIEQALLENGFEAIDLETIAIPEAPFPPTILEENNFNDIINTVIFKKMVEKKISSTIIDGNEIQRRVVFEGIQYFEVSKGHAEIIWKVYLLDSEDNVIIHPDIETGRVVKSPLSNSNLVDANGVMVTKELTKLQNPIGVDESEEHYTTRIEKLYNETLLTATPEFNFYITAMESLPLPVILDQAIGLLDSLGRFDRIS